MVGGGLQRDRLPPLAAGVYCPFTLAPQVAALSMSGSPAIVAINALLLKRNQLAGIRSPQRTNATSAERPSDAARRVTGRIAFVNAGFNVMGA